MNRKFMILLAFAGGIVVGMNWDKIKKASMPIIKNVAEKSVDGCAAAVRFFAEQKERLEDQRAASTSAELASSRPVKSSKLKGSKNKISKRVLKVA